jgi:glycosyltransferase involved in cell wall biosynthesis
MRVTLLSKALVVGAYQRKCELIAAHSDIELTVLVPPCWDNQPSERAHTQGYDLRAIPIHFNGNFHLHYYPTLAQELARAKPDVFHIDEEPYNLATWLAFHSVPLFHVGRGLVAHTGHAVRGKGLPRPRTLFFSWQNIQRRYPPPFNWIERDVLKRADAAIVGNCEAKAVWRAKGFSRDIYVIPQFGVDEETFSLSLHEGESRYEGFTIGFVGRLVHQKGVDLLLRAFTGLPGHAKLIIVNSGGDQEDNLRALASQLNIAKRIQFRSNIASTQMPALYHELDVFVLPSRSIPSWKEQFGRVLIEAMSCGVPVVGSRCGEIPNVIGDAGLLFDEEDVDGLRAHLCVLMEQPRLHEDLAQRGHARVLDNYTMKRIADQTVEVYHALACV